MKIRTIGTILGIFALSLGLSAHAELQADGAHKRNAADLVDCEAYNTDQNRGTQSGILCRFGFEMQKILGADFDYKSGLWQRETIWSYYPKTSRAAVYYVLQNLTDNVIDYAYSSQGRCFDDDIRVRTYGFMYAESAQSINKMTFKLFLAGLATTLCH